MITNQAEALFAEGWTLFLAGQASEAREIFRAAVAVATHDPLLHGRILARLALMHEYLGDVPASIQTSREALERLPVDAAERVNVLFSLSHRLLTSGDAMSAYEMAQQAVELARKLDVPALDRANALVNFGNAALIRNLAEDAVRAYEEAHEIFAVIKDPAGVAAALSSLGNVRQAMRDLDGARKLYEQALEAARASEQWMAENDALTNLGRVIYSGGDIPNALRYFEEARSGARQRSHLARLALTCYDVGLMHENLEAFEDAIAAYQESYDTVLHLGRPDFELRVLRSLLNCMRRAGRGPETLKWRQHVLKLARRCRDPLATLEMLDNFAIVHAQHARLSAALDYWESALALGRRLGRREREVAILDSIRRIYQLSERNDLAISVAEEIVALYRGAELRPEEAWSLVTLAQIQIVAGFHADAEEPLRQAETLAAEIRDGLLIGVVIATRANATLAGGDAKAALGLFEQAIGVLDTHGDRRAQSVALSNMARAFDAVGDPVRAHACRRDMTALRIGAAAD